MNCADCNLCKTRRSIVWGAGNETSRLMLVGEAPGEQENDSGIPFVGKAGRELDEQYLRLFARMPRDRWYVTNVLKCRPPRNRDPKPEEIRACERHLLKEIGEVRPTIIGALGKFAVQWFLGQDADIGVLHGIPQRMPMGGPVVVPCYHPAAGLHDAGAMIMIQRDFEALGQAVRGEISPEMWMDEYPETACVLSDRGVARTPISINLTSTSGLDIVAADTESNPDGSTWSVQLTSIPGRALFVEGRMLRAETQIINISAALLIVHHALHDLPILRRHFAGLPPKILDTMLMAYVLQDEPQGLKALAYRHCGMKMQEYEDIVREPQKVLAERYLKRVAGHGWPKPEPVLVWKDDKARLKRPWPIPRKAASALKSADSYKTWMNVPPEEGRGLVEEKFGRIPVAGLRDVIPLQRAREYACRDADATYRVFPKLWRRVKDHGLEEIFWIDSGIVDMLLDMMKYGMPINREQFSRLAVDFGRTAADIEGEIHRIVGEYVNPASSKQVADLLFKKLGLKSRKRTRKGQESTDQKYLEQMRGQHEVVGKILEWRKYTKLRSTYAEALPKLADEEGRIHPTILHTRTSTGRLATKSPNLQNVPIRSKEGRMIRDCFVSDEGCSFLSVDYSGIELRCVAHLSGDERMCEVYRRDGDLHAETARLIFGVDKRDQDPYKHRIPSKTANFSIIYGVSPSGLYDTILKNGGRAEDWSEDRCKELIDGWFKAYPGVKKFMDLQELRARRYGYVWDMFGRIRRIPEVKSSLPYVVAAGLREAGNQPVQSTAQGIMKIAMQDLVPVYKRLLEERWRIEPMMQIHDSLEWHVENRRIKLFYQILKAVMENAVRLSIPIKVDGKYGRVWGSMKEVPEEWA